MSGAPKAITLREAEFERLNQRPKAATSYWRWLPMAGGEALSRGFLFKWMSSMLWHRNRHEPRLTYVDVKWHLFSGSAPALRLVLGCQNGWRDIPPRWKPM